MKCKMQGPRGPKMNGLLELTHQTSKIQAQKTINLLVKPLRLKIRAILLSLYTETN